MTQEIKHTPTPWHMNVNSKFPIYAGTNQYNWKHICNMIHNDSTTMDERDANMVHIVKCVNENEPLHARIKELEEVLDGVLSAYDSLYEKADNHWLNPMRLGDKLDDVDYEYSHVIKKAKELNNDK